MASWQSGSPRNPLLGSSSRMKDGQREEKGLQLLSVSMFLEFFRYGWKRGCSAFAPQLLSHVFREWGPWKCFFFFKVLLKRYSCRKVCGKIHRHVVCCTFTAEKRCLCVCPCSRQTQGSRIEAATPLIWRRSCSSSPHLSCVFSSPNPSKQEN